MHHNNNLRVREDKSWKASLFAPKFIPDPRLQLLGKWSSAPLGPSVQKMASFCTIEILWLGNLISRKTKTILGGMCMILIPVKRCMGCQLFSFNRKIEVIMAKAKALISSLGGSRSEDTDYRHTGISPAKSM